MREDSLEFLKLPLSALALVAFTLAASGGFLTRLAGTVFLR